MPNLFQTFLNQVKTGYKKADKNLGGWLPGGGTAAPPVEAIQKVTPTKTQVIHSLRDQLLVPVLDQGIKTGVLPTKETMFARYLTGTSKPLTVYPQSLLGGISNTYDNTAIETTRKQVNEIFKKENPLFREYETSKNQFETLLNSLRNNAEMKGIEPSAKEKELVKQYEEKTNTLGSALGIKQILLPDELPASALSNQERLKIIQKHNLVQPGNITLNYDAAYGTMPEDVQLSLGRFQIKNNIITDRYTFNDLEYGRENIAGRGKVYPDAAGGGQIASDLIELGLKTGILNPNSGYDIRIPYKNN